MSLFCVPSRCLEVSRECHDVKYVSQEGDKIRKVVRSIL